MFGLDQQSLDHIHNRKMLESLPMEEGEEGKGSLASDGETSDYQRSTPSPQDGNSLFPELGEGLEKADCSPGLPPSETTCTTTGTEWKATNVSPDLGFEDYVDSGSNNGPLNICSSDVSFTAEEIKSPELCYGAPSDPKEENCPTVNVKTMLLGRTNNGVETYRLNSRLLEMNRQNISVPSRRFKTETDTSQVAHRAISSPMETDSGCSENITTAKILLNKQLKVEIEKLPSVMSTMLPEPKCESFLSNHVGCQSTRKRYTLAGSSISRAMIQRTGSKKCPSYPAADHTTQRTTSKIASSVKEVSISQPRLLNSFRITKPKPTHHFGKDDNLPASLAGLPCFSSRSFYNKKKDCNSIKHCDLISQPPTLSPSSISRKIENKQVSFFEAKQPLSQAELGPGRHNTALQKGGEGDSLDKLSDPRSQIDVADIQVESEKCPSSQELLKKDSQNKPQGHDIPVLPRTFRYPTLQANSGAIFCKWDNCGVLFKTHGKLYDHMKTEHVAAQLAMGESVKYSCLWQGCKVYGKKSSSKSWMEKHVPSHGGKFAYACIVEDCKMRFSSQVMLERHVNSHFSETTSSSAQTGPRKSIEGAPARKVLKRAGVKLKFRRLPYSARIFDFFDAGIMSGIRHHVAAVDQRGWTKFNMHNDSIEFRSKAISIRKDDNGRRKVRLKWIPEDLLPDEWVPLEDAQPTKTVKLCNLPEKTKAMLQHELLCKPQRVKQSRKTKRVEPPSVFLTPGEVSCQSPDSQ